MVGKFIVAVSILDNNFIVKNTYSGLKGLD